MNLYSDNHMLKDAKLPDIVRLCMDGDIRYDDARKWCREHDFSEHTFDRWLYLALREYPNADLLEQLGISVPEPDILHRIAEHLRHILGWFQMKLED